MFCQPPLLFLDRTLYAEPGSIPLKIDGHSFSFSVWIRSVYAFAVYHLKDGEDLSYLYEACDQVYRLGYDLHRSFFLIGRMAAVQIQHPGLIA